MLIRLIILGLMVFGAIAGFRFWNRGRQLLGTGTLNLFEVKRIFDLSRESKRLEAAILLRNEIMREAQNAGEHRLGTHVDRIVRRLAQQTELVGAIAKSLSGNAIAGVDAEIQEAKAALAKASTEADKVLAENQERLLEARRGHLDSLKKRKWELDSSGDAIIKQLKNLHLALMNANAAEANQDQASLTELLSKLKDTSEDLSRRADAEREVSEIIAKQRRSLEAGTKSRS